MTRSTNARIAGLTFLVYIVAGIAGMMLFSQAAAGENIGARLESLAAHATTARVTVLLALVQGFSAFVLGVTLYAITRDQDADLALLALVCRIAEGVTGLFVARSLGLIWLATSAPEGADRGAAALLSMFLFRMGGWNPGAVLFAVGSALFCWLMLRGRVIPIALAWLGVAASILLVVLLPLQLAGLASGALTSFAVTWLPMLVFEVTLALWLLFKGVAAPMQRQTS